MAPRGRSSRRADQLQREALDARDKPVRLECVPCGHKWRMKRLATTEETHRAAVKFLDEHQTTCEAYERLHGRHWGAPNADPADRQDVLPEPGEGDAGSPALSGY